jgi:formylglycine-generating enzyme required for sulfatase activity
MLLERAKDPAGVLRLYQKILHGKKEIEDDEQSLNKSHLKLSGVVRRRKAKLRLTNRIYREVFNLDWIREHLPRFERRRQILISTTIIALLVAFSSMTGWYRPLIYRPIQPAWREVPAGEFLMGANAEQGYQICVDTLGEDYDCQLDWYKDEEPPHTVSLDAYQIMAHEVTNKEYRQCVQAGVCEDAGYKTYDDQGELTYDRLVDEAYENHPVVSVSWFQAAAYCVFIDARLPSEAEWEKAARGTDGRTYPWNGDEIDCSYANYSQYDLDTQIWHDCIGETTKVGSYEKGVSPYGAFDMAGNVWEWTADWYDAEYYSTSPTSNPTGPESGDFRVLRGGSWDSVEVSVRTSSRNRSDPSNAYNFLDFRCARSP